MIVKTFHPSYPLYDSWKVTPPCEYPDEPYCHYLCPFAEECGIEDPFAEEEDDDDYDPEDFYYE